MTNTVWEFDQVPAERLAHGYRWENDRWNPEPMLHDGTFGAMGGLITTVDDFARYVAFHLDAWPPRDDAESGPVRRATLREMHRPAEVLSVITDTPPADGKPNPRVAAYSYGLSWNTDARGATWVRHAGGLPGFGSEYRFLPEHGVALISFANLTYAPMTAVNGQAMEVLLEQAKLRPRVPVPSPSLQTRASQLTMILQQWPAQLVADAFAPNVFQDKSEADWRAQVDELLRQAGRIRSVTPLAPDNQLRGRFSLLGERGRIEVFFTLMPEAVPKIQDLRLSFVANPAEPRP
jgi:CubicO group peptidase (beta-lactamase class C family)